LKQTNNVRIAVLAVTVFALDQITKLLVLKFLPVDAQREVIPDFFKLVHWQNPGAAWSMFQKHNWLLAVISVVALVVLVLVRRKFGSDTTLGAIALGLIFGGIVGNLLDRLVHQHVIDFLYFHLKTRGGKVYDFPAFNVADTAICTGVGLLFLLSWRGDKPKEMAVQTEGAET
jgi:signal peptidase II